MKIFGLVWMFFNFLVFGIGAFLFNKMSHANSQLFIFSNPVYGYLLMVVCLMIFINLIIIKGNTLIIIRPLWFLYKKNKFKISEFNNVELIKFYHATTSSTNVKFINKEETVIINTTIYWFKFEEKQFINKLKEFGVKVDCDFD